MLLTNFIYNLLQINLYKSKSINTRVYSQLYKMDTYNYNYKYTKDTLYNYMSNNIYNYNNILINYSYKCNRKYI